MGKKTHLIKLSTARVLNLWAAAVLRGVKTGHCRITGCENGPLSCCGVQKWDTAAPCKNGMPLLRGAQNRLPPCLRVQKWDSAAPQDAEMGHRCTFGHENGPPPCLRAQKWAVAAPHGMKTGMGHGVLCHARMERVSEYYAGASPSPLHCTRACGPVRTGM